MSVTPARPSALDRLFGRSKPLIGDIHLLPLPGTPRHRDHTVEDIVRRAVEDARAYANGGMDGVIVGEPRRHSLPEAGEIGPEIVAAMAVVASAVREAVAVPVGINILANAAIPALAVAKASGARFVRVNQWVNAMSPTRGWWRARAPAPCAFRRMIDADGVSIFADVHVKHGSHALVADRPVAEQARDVEFFDADVAIATGNRTGDAVPKEEIAAIRDGTQLPVIGGSGLPRPMPPC